MLIVHCGESGMYSVCCRFRWNALDWCKHCSWWPDVVKVLRLRSMSTRFHLEQLFRTVPALVSSSWTTQETLEPGSLYSPTVILWCCWHANCEGDCEVYDVVQCVLWFGVDSSGTSVSLLRTSVCHRLKVTSLLVWMFHSMSSIVRQTSAVTCVVRSATVIFVDLFLRDSWIAECDLL